MTEYVKKEDVMLLLRVLDFSMKREELAQKMNELPTIKLSENDFNMIEYGRLVRGQNR